ncbi:sulfite exporter TauE/SafE family protein [Porphyrobacter sp. ULC335]|uniref:sulfite exporter TauE/SafE family protein n=1 Tax=Porphyrobacter sp. ULC335 TaxID=2854260 RepID=UPI00221F2EDE|nr:sulfite exporter TauE/SafE family protein [Porphyrobacter sp. ULC335]UYV15827.1 sulfite exporter TauE/SafE family protein [Porphyrobacter sp. ULC335]
MPDIIQLLIDIAPFIAIGFAAQMIDGALGMAFGVTTQTLLVSAMGVPPASASASVHLVELFTTGASGLSHAWHRNVDWGLFRRLVPYGVLGGVTGAYVLSNVDASAARPFVMIYLTGIGFYLLWRAIRMAKPRFEDPRYTRPLAVAGGFLDAAGGGGWGPVVTSNLLIQGGDPRKIIGTVNTAEFLLTLSISITFLITLGPAAFTIITGGLIIGGVVAAPFGALLASRVQPRLLLLAVALVLIITSAYSIAKAWPII